MTKLRLTSILLSSMLVFNSELLAAAEIKEPAPGTKMSKISPSPYGELEQNGNITNFMTPVPIERQTKEIYFSANEMENNQNLETITAIGDVNIIRNGLTLNADKVIYNQKDDVVTAVGNVRMIDADNNVVFSDYVVLTNQMSQGEMDNIKVIMKDESRIAARRIRTYPNNNKVMNNAVYSPCDVCALNPKPLWQLKARKITHDAESQNVYYKDAVLEVKNIPVFYTPFLSHPDPTVKRRSGFLIPSFGSSNYLDGFLQPRYFWDLSPHDNLTFSPILSTNHGLILDADYSGYFERGYLSTQGSVMKDDDDDETRGNLSLQARYELNDYWVSDLDLNYVSDSLYLKDLSLPNKEDAWLTSSAKLQGFDNRNYASIEAYYYKLISYELQVLNAQEFRRRKYDKPYVLPLITYENISEPGQYGAYFKNTFDFASVMREQDTSSQRMTMINSWNLPYTSPYGEKYRLVASVKSDAYYIDNYTNPDNEKFTGETGRIFPQLGLEWKMPFVKATDTSRHIVEPVVVAVAAPNGGNKIDKIPNEDSQNSDLDDTNVLDIDRYAGYDRNDTDSRISYGLNWSSYGTIMGHTQAFIAQSYNFSNDHDEFGADDNEDSHFSDYVGRIYANPNKYLDMNYRFRFDKDDLEMKYSELSARVGPDIFHAYFSYIYLQENEATIAEDIGERKELYMAIGSQLTRDWSISIYNRQDLTNGGNSLEHGGSLVYEDECIKIIGDLHRYDSIDPEDENDFEFTVSLYLKTLGGVGSK